MKKSGLDVYILLPIKNFIEKQTSVGISLIIATVLALLIANSPLAEFYHKFWKQEIFIGMDEFVISKSLHHWINDGLMSMFFFLVGLELKREVMHGELSSFRGAVLPVAAALGGMLFPALIYFFFNMGTDSISGWGIPMATDIAFALGILYLLNDRVPVSLKIFLTAIAIADDLGAVLVIAFFYTEQISLDSLGIGVFFLAVLILANYIGIRNVLFYAVMGIGGLWLAILLSGIHATIAAVLAAFAIPTSKRINTPIFLRKVKLLSYHIKKQLKKPYGHKEKDQEEISNTIEKFSLLTQDAIPPLQRLENALYPFVSFVVLPLFAFANAGVSFTADSLSYFLKPVSLGILLGLILGKFFGIVLFTRLMVSLGISSLPKKVQWKHIYGVGLLAAIGFTMSLFITELAFDNETYLDQAKIGIFSASLLAGVMGYFYLKYINR
ncbi:Na+/H+ antiporter NhaA [Gramella sp. KN1008]|uniref:Na+/H+ antiporter NhaA n=1 Tax=Gramella sp. KN1008 TaxID=2529298 RepID=UPI00103B748D|nr:Na+/H+ antiporter NhaA [Gramella sp. KN1008]TBW28027.1 Na+/H+ antiporter NhaA [Gramella sp. KN1008]